MKSIWILAACRSPVSPRNGDLGKFKPHEFGFMVASECLDRAGISPCQVDELIVGSVLGQGGNPARIISLALGLDARATGITIDRQCASGLDALLLADALIKSGKAEAVLVGGVESYTHRPVCYPSDQFGIAENPCLQPAFTPWPDADPDMFDAAARLAERYNISREEQDMWAVDSNRKAIDSQNRLAGEIVVAGGQMPGHDGVAGRITRRLSQRVAPITGTITPANTAIEADGAAFCLLASERIAQVANCRVARLAGGLTLGGDHELPGHAPVPAIRETLDTLDLTPSAISCSEIMEAFAVQAIVAVRESGLDPRSVNICGGALARGHPIGASGAILAVRLFHEMCRKPGYGLAAIAAAGGLATCLVMES